MAFFNSAVSVLQIIVIALGGALVLWGLVNLAEGYGNDNRGDGNRRWPCRLGNHQSVGGV